VKASGDVNAPTVYVLVLDGLRRLDPVRAEPFTDAHRTPRRTARALLASRPHRALARRSVERPEGDWLKSSGRRSDGVKLSPWRIVHNAGRARRKRATYVARRNRRRPSGSSAWVLSGERLEEAPTARRAARRLHGARLSGSHSGTNYGTRGDAGVSRTVTGASRSAH
jgi:hypothetical protein